MNIQEIRAEITRMREERDRHNHQAKILTNCIIALAKKRDQIIEESNPDKVDLYTEMFS